MPGVLFSHGLEPASETLPEQYFFDTFGTEFGLPQTNVTATLQTRDGYLWVGTEGGLGRFDGVRFVAFRRSNVPAFINHSIRCLFEGADEVLWIGTESGVVRYHEGAFQHVGLSGAIVTAIAQDSTGRLWIGTEEKGLHALSGGELRSYEADPAMPGSSVRCVFVDSRDRVWAGFARTPGFVCFEDEKFSFREIGGEPARDSYAICEWPRGTLWFGCGRGLYRMIGDEVVRFTTDDGLYSMQVTDLQVAREGGLWLVAGTIHRVTNVEPFAVTAVPRLPASNPRSVCEDREGSLWISAQAEGLIRARRMYYRTVTTDEGLPGNVIKAVSQDEQGNTWLAIQRYGLTRVAPDGTVTVFREDAGLPSSDPLTTYAARDGAVWVGISTALCVLREGRCEVFPEFRQVRLIYQDRRGNMWFGNDGNLIRWDRASGFVAIEHEGRPLGVINGIAEDVHGTIYVATSPGGLVTLSHGVVTGCDPSSGFPTAGVRALHVDREGRVWAGIKGRGLGVLADGRWLTADALAEAVTDHVSAIAEDEEGQLWLGTPSGIMWAPKEELLALARGELTQRRLRIAGRGDGFRVTPASSHSQPTVWSTPGNSFLFATRRGLLEISPAYVPPNRIAPPVHIEQVVVDGHPVRGGAPVELAPGVRQIVVEYTALSFIEPQRVAFQYRLDGYDAGWVDAGTRRVASYAHLPSGAYEFRVRACNSDGQWNEVGDSVRLLQLPYFYETWWFGGLACLTVGLAGFGLFRWSHRRLELELERMEAKHAMERERLRIAKNLHDDLGANLTEIGLFAESVRRKTTLPEAQKDLSALSERVRGVVGSLDEIVWAANPANDSLDQLATYLCEYFQSLFSRSSIRCRLEVADDMPAHPLTPEERTHLFLTAKEAMNNVVKHSAATQVSLSVKMEGDVFALAIEDDGRGFDPSAPEHRRRHGLENMRSRIGELGGTLTVDSTPGRGTRVRISLSFAERERRPAADSPASTS